MSRDVTLFGGPHDGCSIRVPDDETLIVAGIRHIDDAVYRRESATRFCWDSSCTLPRPIR